METHVARPLRVALAQADFTVGDLGGNSEKIAGWIGRARDLGACTGPDGTGGHAAATQQSTTTLRCWWR